MTCQGQSISFDQALQYATNAGFIGRDAYTITAIAQAESGLCANNTSSPNNDGSVDRGPYQLNSKAQAKYPDSCAYDWQCSANAAHSIYQGWGNSFNAWTTYKSGKYAHYMPTREQLSTVTTQGIQSAQQIAMQGSGPSWQSQLQSMATGIGEHIAIFAIALVLVIIGVLMMIHKPVEQAVGSAV
jgi:hypothetical protein